MGTPPGENLLFSEVGADVEMPRGPLVRHGLALVAYQGVEFLEQLCGCHAVLICVKGRRGVAGAHKKCPPRRRCGGLQEKYIK